MGMMGRLSEKDRRTMIKGVRGIAMHDISMVENAVLEIGEFRGKPDRKKLYQDLKKFIAEYGTTSMGGLDVATAIEELVEIMRIFNIILIHDSHRIPFHSIFVQQAYSFHHLSESRAVGCCFPVFVMIFLRAVD